MSASHHQKCDIKHIVNRLTVNYLKQIETIVSNDSGEKSAVYYRFRVVDRLTDDQLNELNRTTQSETNQCLKCYSRLSEWRVRPKRATDMRNRFTARCVSCGHMVRLSGIERERKHKPSKVGARERVRRGSSRADHHMSATQTPQTTQTTPHMAAKRRSVLQTLISSSKKKKHDRKTGLFDFLQSCSQ